MTKPFQPSSLNVLADGIAEEGSVARMFDLDYLYAFGTSFFAHRISKTSRRHRSDFFIGHDSLP